MPMAHATADDHTARTDEHAHEPVKQRNSLVALLVAMRPKQWSKNILLFAGLLFTLGERHGLNVTNPAASAALTRYRIADLTVAVCAFLIFSMVSGAGYLFNDVLDIETDRHHPRKRHRPIAAGQLSPSGALTSAAVIGSLGIGAAFFIGGIYHVFHVPNYGLINLKFGFATAAYVVLTCLYTARFKHVEIFDLLLLAFLFVLRAVAGACAIGVRISEWLVLCTLLLALFLAISKRRGELLAVTAGRKVGRPILSEYSLEMLDQMSNIVTSALLMSYALYTIQSESSAKHHHYLVVTIPFVIYGIFRYLYLVHKHSLGESPDEILYKDKPMLINVILWAVTTAIVVTLP